MTLTEAKAAVGQPVIYRPVAWAPEKGVITYVGDKFVYVRYGSKRVSEATSPEDLLPAPDGAA